MLSSSSSQTVVVLSSHLATLSSAFLVALFAQLVTIIDTPYHCTYISEPNFSYCRSKLLRFFGLKFWHTNRSWFSVTRGKCDKVYVQIKVLNAGKFYSDGYKLSGYKMKLVLIKTSRLRQVRKRYVEGIIE
jgi:hypothetical protein